MAMLRRVFSSVVLILVAGCCVGSAAEAVKPLRVLLITALLYVGVRESVRVNNLMVVLKLGVLAFLYGSPDVTYYCLGHYDRAAGSSLQAQFLDFYSNPGRSA